MKYAPYTIAQATWGFPQTLAGLGVFLANARCPHFRYHGAVVTPWKRREGLSLGLFIFLDGSYKGEGSVDVLVDEQGWAYVAEEAIAHVASDDPRDGAVASAASGNSRKKVVANIDSRLLVHEYGHTVQSLMLGPAYLVVVGIPSLLWLKLPAAMRHRQRAGVSYYAFAPERFANWLGEHVLKEPSF